MVFHCREKNLSTVYVPVYDVRKKDLLTHFSIKNFKHLLVYFVVYCELGFAPLSFLLPTFSLQKLNCWYSFHGAFCFLLTSLSFSGAISSIISTIHELKWSIKSSTEFDVGLENCKRKTCSKRALVWSLIIIFPIITELLDLWGDMENSKKMQELSDNAKSFTVRHFFESTYLNHPHCQMWMIVWWCYITRLFKVIKQESGGSILYCCYFYMVLRAQSTIFYHWVYSYAK